MRSRNIFHMSRFVSSSLLLKLFCIFTAPRIFLFEVLMMPEPQPDRLCLVHSKISHNPLPLATSFIESSAALCVLTHWVTPTFGISQPGHHPRNGTHFWTTHFQSYQPATSRQESLLQQSDNQCILQNIMQICSGRHGNPRHWPKISISLPRNMFMMFLTLILPRTWATVSTPP